MLLELKFVWWPEMQKDIEQIVKHSTARLATLPQVRTLITKFQKNQFGKLEKLTEPGKELQIDFTGKLHNEV